MQVCYCDICNIVLKDKKHIIVIFEDAVFKEQYSGGVSKKKDTYEICDSCLKLIEDIFKYKKTKSTELKKLVDKIYQVKKKRTTRKKRGRK